MALYKANEFPLPKNVVEHLVNEQLKGIKEQQYLGFMKQYYAMQISNSLVNSYLFKKLKAEYDLTLTDADLDNFIEHQAIMEDHTVENWKETNAKKLEDEDFKDEVLQFTILLNILAKSEFVEAEELPEEHEAHEHKETSGEGTQEES
jgi:hypothetical protein